MNLGSKILKIRKDNKMSQEDFAEELNVTRQTISNWENGKNYPDIETLIAISDKFNISLDVLLKGEEKMVKDMDKKIKSHKILIIIIILLIVFGVLCKVGEFIYHKYIYYRNINIDSGAYVVTKCNYEGERLKLMVKYPAYNQDKKWYEPYSYDPQKVRPIEYKVTENWPSEGYERKVKTKIMEDMNFKVEDYSNSFDLLEDMQEYMVSIGAKCDNYPPKEDTEKENG